MMKFNAVLVNGQHLKNLSETDICELFVRGGLDSDSMICPQQPGADWRPLKNHFDLNAWVTRNGSVSPGLAGSALKSRSPHPTPDSHTQANESNSQNNQSETYYQAGTTANGYDFGRQREDIAPSRYNVRVPGNRPRPRRDAPIAATSVRTVAIQAAILIIMNALIFMAFRLVYSFSGSAAVGFGTGGSILQTFVPLAIDIALAVALVSSQKFESIRIAVLVRTYLGFFIFGIAIPASMIVTRNYPGAAFLAVATTVYTISLALTLHGRSETSTTRLLISGGTFAVYFLLMLGATGFVLVNAIAPENFDSANGNRQFEKYRLEGRDFRDKTTGATISIPSGWWLIALDNPIVRTPEARMIAVDEAGQSLSMLEVVPVPGHLDMKRQDHDFILTQLADRVVESLRKQKSSPRFSEKDEFSELGRESLTIGRHPGRIVFFEKTVEGQKMRGQVIITYDELTFYVLHSWCPAAAFVEKKNDFDSITNSFKVPDQINSTFSQTAESAPREDSKPRF